MIRNLSLNTLGTRFECQGKTLTVVDIKKKNVNQQWQLETELLLQDDNGNEYWNCWRAMHGIVTRAYPEINYNVMSGWVYVYNDGE